MIGLIFIGDIIYCPYLNKYEAILKEKEIEYEIVYWNRSGIKEDIDRQCVTFKLKSELKKVKYQRF